MGWSPTLTWLPWGPKWQLNRRVLQTPLATSRVRDTHCRDLQHREALICCRTMMDDPAGWWNAVRRFSVAVMLDIAYGIEVDGPDSPWIKLADEASRAVGRSGAPASSIMDRVPISEQPPSFSRSTLAG